MPSELAAEQDNQSQSDSGVSDDQQVGPVTTGKTRKKRLSIE
jgi:hypothetical protein